MPETTTWSVADLQEELRRFEAPGGNLLEDLGQVKVNPCQNRLRFGISQAAIELQDLWSGLRQHQTDVQKSLIANPICGQALQCLLNDC